VFKRSDTNVPFQIAIFFVLVIRKNKWSFGIDGKISDYLSRMYLYYHYLVLHFH